MKTKQMQTRLNDLAQAGKLESGETYSLLPSDCRGDGYDIGMRSRPDESGSYTLPDGRVCEVECVAKMGSRVWSRGIPSGYQVAVEPAPVYRPKIGQRVVVVRRVGNNIGNSYMHRVCASLAVWDEGLDRYLYRGHTPYWLGGTAVYAEHYRSGLSRADQQAYDLEVARLTADAARCNAVAWGGGFDK